MVISTRQQGKNRLYSNYSNLLIMFCTKFLDRGFCTSPILRRQFIKNVVIKLHKPQHRLHYIEKKDLFTPSTGYDPHFRFSTSVKQQQESRSCLSCLCQLHINYFSVRIFSYTNVNYVSQAIIIIIFASV